MGECDRRREHEFTSYGVRDMLEARAVDILQVDTTVWVGSAARKNLGDGRSVFCSSDSARGQIHNYRRGDGKPQFRRCGVFRRSMSR